MTASSVFRHSLCLPMWAIVGMIGAGAFSVLFAPGSFFTSVTLILLVVNVISTVRYFGKDVVSLGETWPVPIWLLVTLGLGSLWTVVVIMEIIGFLMGLIFFLGVVAVLIFAAVAGFKAAKAKGLI